MSRLLLIAAIHCIHDIIFIEFALEAPTAYHCWRALAVACGWNVPDDRSPPPASLFRALVL